MIILIDGEISKSVYDFTINDFKVFDKKVSGKYLPGDLVFENFNELTKNSVDDYNISFEAVLTKKNIVTKKLYNIKMPYFFLNQDYVIINIFNKDNKVYKKRYPRINKDSKDYYVVIETPSSMKFD